ncbi:MAG: hypothetical protein ACXWTT_01515, partial [Methylobacter sp.]
MFTNPLPSAAGFTWLEHSSPSALATISHGGSSRASDHSPLALGLVLCAHLAALAALRPDQIAQSFEKAPE